MVVVIPVGYLGAGDDVVTDLSRPRLGYPLKNRLNSCEVYSRATLNNGIEGMLDIIEGLNIVV